MAERSPRHVPRRVMLFLGLAFAGQLLWHGARSELRAEAEDLRQPPSVASLRVLSLGEPLVLAKALMLWLQAHDNQPGISIPFLALDYRVVRAWLGRILDLDPRGQYPLLAASRVYGVVPDAQRKRVMLEFVYQRFFEDPGRRWPWLAHAAIVAKHRLRDLPLALKYARAITDYAHGAGVPDWARHMSVVILEDMGELDAARFLIGGLIHSGRVTDPHEIWFLEQKLAELDARQGAQNP